MLFWIQQKILLATSTCSQVQAASMCKIIVTAAYFNPLEFRGNYSATLNNMKLVHWPLMGGLLQLVQRGGDWAPRSLLAVPNVIAHPLTASVPITALLYNGPLLCDFNVTIKGYQLTNALTDVHKIIDKG